MRLYLAQHGEALDKAQDPERPLSPAGRADVERLAAHLAGRGLRVGAVLHSGKTRARQSAEITAAAIAPGVAPAAVDPIAPNDPPQIFIEATVAHLETDTWVAGHLPFQARCVALLIGLPADPPPVLYTPGSVVCLEGEGHRWAIAWMLRPELV